VDGRTRARRPVAERVGLGERLAAEVLPQVPERAAVRVGRRRRGLALGLELVARRAELRRGHRALLGELRDVARRGDRARLDDRDLGRVVLPDRDELLVVRIVARGTRPDEDDPTDLHDDDDGREDRCGPHCCSSRFDQTIV
jgi:hypothetical protein